MSTKIDSDKFEFSWNELVPLLFAAKGITEGLWHVGVRLRFAGASVGPTSGKVLPSAIVSVSAVALSPVEEAGPLVYDAKASVRQMKSAVVAKAAKAAKAENTPPRRTARKATAKD